MARRQSSLRDLIVVVVVLLAVWGGPRLIRGYAALQWTRHDAARTPDGTGQHARDVTRWAEATVNEVAPLPWSRTACTLALDYAAREEEASHPGAARAIYEGLVATLDPLVQSRWRGLGLADSLARARAGAARAGAAARP